MSNPLHKPDFYTQQRYPDPPRENPNKLDFGTILKHLGLFLATFFCVSLAGAAFVGFHPSLFFFKLPSWTDFLRGTLFAVLLLGFLGVHEFGHYFAGVYHKIRVTLPYFIPVPFGIGTLGAVIRIKERINHSYKMFDVGVAGPLAGFVVSLGVLLWGFATLPDASYIMHFQGHEALKQYISANGHFPAEFIGNKQMPTLMLGNTLLYSFLAQFFQNVPPMYEMYHYPFLFAGWMGLFFTALNLTPVGQLDGGHILYSLIGYKKHRLVARLFLGVMVSLAGIQAIPFIHQWLGDWDTANGTLSLLIWAAVLFLLLRRAFKNNHRWIAPMLVTTLTIATGYLYLWVGNISASGSLIWVVWSFFIVFFVGIEHPRALYEQPLDPSRKILGWLAMILFILCISPNPIYTV